MTTGIFRDGNMSKAILEFDLTDEDDIISFDQHKQCLEMHLALWTFDQHLRGLVRYGRSDTDNEYEDEDLLAIEKIREDLYSFLLKYNVDINLLT